MHIIRQASRQVGRYIDKQTAKLPAPVDDDACIARFTNDQNKIHISDVVKANMCAKLGWELCGFGWCCMCVLLHTYIMLLYCNTG